MVGVVENRSGGILTLLSILAKCWGAAERDLYNAHHTWEDVGTQQFPFHALVSFMLNAPPGTAVYHQLTEGWDVAERLAALELDALKLLLWSKTKDAHAQPPRNRPKPTWQPGMAVEEPEEKEHAVMTIEDYMQRVGMS